jgi:hypothetical protein
MSHPFYHAKSSAKKYGGQPEDYIAIHEWFDQTKAHLPDARHRSILHSSFGIYLAQQVFGEVIVRKSDGKPVPTRLLGEQHILEDMGFIPTVQDWLKELPIKSWMLKGAKALSKELENAEGKSEHSAESGTLCEGKVSPQEDGQVA